SPSSTNKCLGTAIMAASTRPSCMPCLRRRAIIMPRERSEFKPKLTLVDVVLRTDDAVAGTLPCKMTRVLLLLAETPPPKLERPKRLVLPVEKGEGATGLRITAPP